MKSSRFYRDLCIDLKFERDRSVYCYLLERRKKKKKKAKTHLSARKTAFGHDIVYFVNSGNNYYTRRMQNPINSSLFRYILL